MDPRIPKMWQGWEDEVRADLMAIAQQADSAYTQQTVLERFRLWDSVKCGSEIIEQVAPVVLCDNNRGTLLILTMDHLIWAFATKTREHCPKLRQIIHENRDIPVRNWPTIKLTTPQGDEVIGFRIPRVIGGDGQDYRYYYFPEEYVRLHGREAARKQVER
jgi:hypothetical protein